MTALGILAGILAGVAVFAFLLAALERSEWLLLVGAGCLAGFVTATLGWASLLVACAGR